MYKVALLWLSLILFSCSTETTTDPTPDTYPVTVTGGYGSGEFAPGDTVHIWSEPTTSTRVFDGWTLNGVSSQLNREWHVWFIMPEGAVTATASYRAVTLPAFQRQNITLYGQVKPVDFAFPPNPVGLIFLFHGTQGMGANWFQRVEYLQFTRDALAAGFGVVATDAYEVTAGDQDGNGKLRWLLTPVSTNPAQNIDIATIAALRDTLRGRGFITTSTPTYAVGMSNGGGFSGSVAAALRFKAGVSYCASGRAAIYDTSTVPTRFHMAALDIDEDAVNADARANTQDLQGRGICAAYLENPRSPVYAERFARIPGISTTTSAALRAELQGRGFLDIAGYLVGTATALEADLANSPGSYPTYYSLNGSQRIEVANELDACRADHQFYSDLNYTTLQFLQSLCN